MSPSAAVGSDAKDHSMQTGLLQRARFFLGATLEGFRLFNGVEERPTS